MLKNFQTKFQGCKSEKVGLTHPFLRPLALPGGKRLPNRILPGPMEGVTTGSFCAVLSRLGYVRCWITPFIRLTTGIPRPSRLRKRLQPYTDTGLPVVAQIMGVDSDLLVDAAARLAGLGVIGVDLNCGCPSRTVLAKGAGAGRLRDPAWIHRTLAGMRSACPDISISVKLRSGLDSPDELADILAAVREAAPAFIVLHYRTAGEHYRPVPGGWSRLAKARECLPDLPLFGSGDLFTPDDALRMGKETGVDGVAPARGLMRNPRLLRDIERVCAGERPEPDTVEHRSRLLREIASAGGADPAAPAGFVLELARHMFGVDSERYRALTAGKKAGNTIPDP